MKKTKRTPQWKCPEPLWEVLSGIVKTPAPSPKGGRPPSDLRSIVDGIYYVLKSGISWNHMPPCFASSSTCHRYFQKWQKEGVFQLVWAECLARYDDDIGIDWNKLNIDSSHVKSPLGGEKNRS